MTYIQPLLSILILLLVVAAIRSRRRGGKPALVIVAAAALFAISWLPLARAIERPLDSYYLARAAPRGDAQAMVVVSGEMRGPNPVTGERRTGDDTYERCLYAAWLFKHGRPLPIVVSGGRPRKWPSDEPDAAVMRRVLERAGVPDAMIWPENRSHSTHENAAYSAAILRQRHVESIILVTSVFQMPRAALCFRHEGFKVLPAACGYESFARFTTADYFPSWKAIQINEDFLHESVGIAWYWLRGWV